MENIYLYHYELEFSVYIVTVTGCFDYDCWKCPYARHDGLCYDYCVFSNSCLTALEMGWF